MSDKTPDPEGNSPEKNKRLRRPHQATQERLLNGVHDQNQNQNTGSESTLSADAPEFIPKYTAVPQQPEDYQVGAYQSYQPEAQEPLWDDFNRLMTFRPSHLSSSQATSGGGTASKATDMFRDVVFTLTTNPANMEEYLKPVLKVMVEENCSETVLRDIVDILFEQCITEANFRYTGAKVCNYLCNEWKTHHVLQSFRNFFLNRCSGECYKKEELLNTNVDRLCGLSMFIGELFLVMEIDTQSGPQKIAALRKAISDLELTLLSRPDDTTVKCATQLLKLTGTALMETTNLPGDFTEVFRIIKSLDKHPSLNKTSHCLINSVLSRVEHNFGVSTSASGASPVSPQQHVSGPVGLNAGNYEVNEPIFYNRMGQPITREEAGFSQEEAGEFEGLDAEEQEAYLQWEAETYIANNPWMDPQDQMYSGQQWSTGDGYRQWSGQDDQLYQYPEEDYQYAADYNPDMDDEMQAAYEQFLKESSQFP